MAWESHADSKPVWDVLSQVGLAFGTHQMTQIFLFPPRGERDTTRSASRRHTGWGHETGTGSLSWCTGHAASLTTPWWLGSAGPRGGDRPSPGGPGPFSCPFLLPLLLPDLPPGASPLGHQIPSSGDTQGSGDTSVSKCGQRQGGRCVQRGRLGRAAPALTFSSSRGLAEEHGGPEPTLSFHCLADTRVRCQTTVPTATQWSQNLNGRASSSSSFLDKRPELHSFRSVAGSEGGFQSLNTAVYPLGGTELWDVIVREDANSLTTTCDPFS